MKLIRTAARGQAAIASLVQRRTPAWERVLPRARRIVDAVRSGGEGTLLRMRERYDGIPTEVPLRIPEVELRLAWENTPAPMRQALKTAARNIRGFAARQRPKEVMRLPSALAMVPRPNWTTALPASSAIRATCRAQACR